MKLNRIVFIVIFFASALTVLAQDAIVNEFLQQYSQGKMEQVRTALPDLLVEYPTDPGVKLLLAMVLEDADKALDIYKEIIQKSPDSQWADDAYWRLIQYYAIKNDAEKADFELNNFRKRYPTSEFLITATDVVRTCKSLANNKLKQAKLAEKKADSAYVVKPIQKNDNSDSKKFTGNSDSKNSGNYGLQVGVYSTLDKAETASKEYASKRLRTSIEEKTVEGKKMFAVVIGNYSSMEAAEALSKLFSNNGGTASR